MALFGITNENIAVLGGIWILLKILDEEPLKRVYIDPLPNGINGPQGYE